MKTDCEILKYVYRKLPFRGGYWRHSINSGDYVSLSSEFPAAAFVSQYSSTFTLKYSALYDIVTIWKDKHGNIVVRILRICNKQTKLTF